MEACRREMPSQASARSDLASLPTECVVLSSGMQSRMRSADRSTSRVAITTSKNSYTNCVEGRNPDSTMSSPGSSF
eukprot:933387-Rhodomonas_salina.1